MAPSTFEAKSYRAGILGLGFIGGADQVSGDALGQRVADLDGTHLMALSGYPRIDVVAGSSRDEGRRQRFTQRTGQKTYANWQTMIEQEQLDIVSVATYAPQHAEMVAACARRGIRAIYCEKPIATRLPDAEEMVTACQRAGSLLVINHNRRFNPNYRRLRASITAGVLGNLTSLSLQWGTGRLGNVGTHLIDASLMLTGQRIRAVSATLDPTNRPDCRGSRFHDPGGWGLLRFESGLMATVDAPDEGKTGARLIVNGTLGRALAGGDEVTLEFWDGRHEHWPSLRSEATGMDRAVAEIVAWLDGASAFAYSAAEAVHTLETIIGFHASHASNGAWVELPLTSGDRLREVNSG